MRKNRKYDFGGAPQASAEDFEVFFQQEKSVPGEIMFPIFAHHRTAPEWAQDSRETSVKLSISDPLRSPTFFLFPQASKITFFPAPWDSSHGASHLFIGIDQRYGGRN